MASRLARAMTASFYLLPHAATRCPNAEFTTTEGFARVAQLPYTATTKYAFSPRRRVALRWPKVRCQHLAKKGNLLFVKASVANSCEAPTMKQTADLQKCT